jgi:hypothetical protein
MKAKRTPALTQFSRKSRRITTKSTGVRTGSCRR